MKRQDFLAIAAAMIAAHRLAKVEGRLTEPMMRRFNGCDEEYEVDVTTSEAFEICMDAGEAATAVAQGLWNAWGNINHYGGLKKTEDEPFFDDDCDGIENPLEDIAKELHDLNDTLCNGEDSIGGSLLKIANSMPDTPDLENLCTELSAISDAIENKE